MMGLAALLAAAAAGHALARWLALPAIPFLVLTGLAVGPTGLVDRHFLQDALVLGLTFLVFLAGLELNPRRVGSQTRAALTVGVGQFLVLGGAGLALGLAFSMGVQASLYLALAVSASSTLVVVRVLQQRRQFYQPVGRMVLGVLLLQDAFVILLIPVVVLFPQGWVAVGVGLVATVGMAALSAVTLRWIAPQVLPRMREDGEALLLLVLAFLFLFLGMSHMAGLPLVVGAFFAGVGISSFPSNGVVRGQLVPVSEFFVALFFTSLGAFMVVPSPVMVAQGAAVALLVLVLTPPVVAFLAERAGYSARPGILAGLLLAQTSEFSLVVGLQGMVMGHVSEQVFTVIAVATLLTMTLTPFLAGDRTTLALLHFHPGKGAPALDPHPTDHILLVGGGTNGQAMLEELSLGSHEVVVVDDDPAVVAFLNESGFRALRGDAGDVEVLLKAGVKEAKMVISTVRRPEDNGPLLAVAPEGKVVARAFNVEDARWIEERGGEAVLFSDAAAEDFLAWYREREG
jgi:CPA2 family monovalent cation:H+ antiporter-2